MMNNPFELAQYVGTLLSRKKLKLVTIESVPAAVWPNRSPMFRELPSGSIADSLPIPMNRKPNWLAYRMI